MKVVLDVNLGPTLAAGLRALRVDAVLWTDIGDARAADTEILCWASEHGAIVVTQDLDHTDILAASQAATPSVILIRDAHALSENLASLVATALDQCSTALASGCILVLSASGRRVRVLPIE